MRITVITLFPELVRPWLEFGPPMHAARSGSLEVVFLNPVFYAETPKDTDDYPFGGGPGMVLRPEPLVRAIADATQDCPGTVMLASARGRPLTQEWVHELAGADHLVLVCGRYKDVDERVLHWVDHEFSAGDFVLSGGEGPVILLLDAVARLLSGAMGHADSAAGDSFESGLIGPPSYTRPRSFLGQEVPEVLLGGDHARIARWRRAMSVLYTLHRRPDLLARGEPEPDLFEILREITKELRRERPDESR